VPGKSKESRAGGPGFDFPSEGAACILFVFWSIGMMERWKNKMIELWEFHHIFLHIFSTSSRPIPLCVFTGRAIFL